MTESTLRDPKSIEKLQRPKRFAVEFLNDDFTTIDFVIEMLMKVFGKSREEAIQITMEIHKNGRAGVGEYTFEVAESKAMIVNQSAKAEQFPLTCHPREL